MGQARCWAPRASKGICLGPCSCLSQAEENPMGCNVTATRERLPPVRVHRVLSGHRELSRVGLQGRHRLPHSPGALCMWS